MDWSPYLLASKLILLICTTVVLPNPLYGEDAVMPSPEEGTYPAPPKMAIMVRRPLGTEGNEFLQKKEIDLSQEIWNQIFQNSELKTEHLPHIHF